MRYRVKYYDAMCVDVTPDIRFTHSHAIASIRVVMLSMTGSLRATCTLASWMNPYDSSSACQTLPPADVVRVCDTLSAPRRSESSGSMPADVHRAKDKACCRVRLRHGTRHHARQCDPTIHFRDTATKCDVTRSLAASLALRSQTPSAYRDGQSGVANDRNP